MEKTINIIAFFTLGSYELHIIKTATSIVNGATLCKEFSLSGIRQHQTAIECNRAMLGDTIIIKKTDEGSLRLFEIYPIGTLNILSNIWPSLYITKTFP